MIIFFISSLLVFHLNLIKFRDPEKVYLNKEGGHLLRTKSSTVNEGGVASGYSFLDTPYLTDE